MASVTGPDSDNSSELTTLFTGDTPTLPGQEQPSIRALFEAHDDAAYDLAVAQIPRDHRVQQVKGIWSRRSAWYWAKEQAEELIRTSKGLDDSGKELRNRKIWKCKHCSEVQFADANSQNKPTHLLVHGISKHGRKTPREWVQRSYLAPSNSDSGDDNGDTTPIRQSGSYVQLATTVKRAPFEEALIAFFVVCQIALRLVADELFVGFLRIVYPSIDKLLPGCGNTLRTLVLEAFNKRKEHLTGVLARSVSKIHFSFDLWTSPNHLALLGVVAHFIDEFGQNQSILITIRQLHGSHSGENQAEVIKEVIQEYNLENRIGYFVTDNASNNNIAIDSLVACFLPHLTPKQRLGRRLRCLGHELTSLLKPSYMHDSLTADDWAVLTEIVAFLEKFYTLTKRAEGSKLSSDRGVLSDYMTILNVLLKHAREYRDDINFRAENPDLTSPGIRQLRWKDAHLWKDATLPESWLPGGKRALYSLWEEYKNLPVAGPAAGSKRARTPDEFERETDMTQWDEDEMDELETWLSMKVFKLDDGDTLPAYWLRQSKQPAPQRIAQMGLDMASIPAMSSDCERVFSQRKLMITGQRNCERPLAS
ncbi:putative AC transposase [Metarhizium anisopliae]|nr:putative AC transposase [Metarhizium anisopliae]